MTEPSQYFKGRTVQEQMDEVIGYVDQRSAEVAVNAIASDVAQVHQDMLDADADASAAAASAAAAAGTLANAVKKTGEASQSIAGDIAVSGDLSTGGDLTVTGNTGVQGQLSVLGGCDLRAPVKIPVSPTNDDDASSKKYVDDSLASYPSMIRTTGNQTKSGELNLTYMLGLKSTNIDESNPPAGYSEYPNVQFNDMNGNRAALMFKAHNNDLNVLRLGNVYNHNGNRQRSYLVCQVNEATGLIIWLIEWGDGTTTEIARKQLA